MAGSSTKRRAVDRKRPQPARTKKDAEPRSRHLLHEAVAIICFAASLFLILSLSSQEIRFGLGGDPTKSAVAKNLMGPVGHVLGRLLSGLMGWCALVPAVWAAWLGLYFYIGETKPPGETSARRSRLYVLTGVLGILIFSCSLAATMGGPLAGGSLGVALSEPLVRYFSSTGAILVSTALFLFSLALATHQTAGGVLKMFGLGLNWFVTIVFIVIPTLAYQAVAFLASRTKKGLDAFYVMMFPPRGKGMKSDEEEEAEALPKPRVRKNALSSIFKAEEPVEEEVFTHAVVRRRSAEEKKEKEKAKEAEKREETVEQKAAKQETATAEEFKATVYQRPEYSLLTKGEVLEGSEDDEELLDKSRQIEGKLKDFGIMGKVTQVHPGPVITLFEFEPAAGVKVGKIAALQDDLAMSLKATSVRIIAPIPKRGTVGIEVPNKQRDIVRLRDVLDIEALQAEESILKVPVGKDTYGDPVLVDISLMPHLLMAGATGTGKSVCINAMIISLLYRASPSEVGLILIDPKILELSVYEGIPHLKVPVVTNPKQAKAVLQWAVNEMNRRYRLMQNYGVRNIDGYNRFVRGEKEPDHTPKVAVPEPIPEEIVPPPPLDPVEAALAEESKKPEPIVVEKLEPLPKIVIVIDELADLMFSVGRDIEDSITRLAQKARASGIHLIVATQRPSVDVITGLIKANFPARLSFRVSSRIDSRTILDSMGAERLLGRGDMLFMQPGAEALKRVHGAFVSDAEVKRVIEQVKHNAKPHYDQAIMDVCEKALIEEAAGAEGGEKPEEEYDQFYDRAVELVVEKGQASTSMIQRAFRIGYNRAARIIEMMEKDGVVGPMDGAKPREVIIPTHAEE